MQSIPEDSSLGIDESEDELDTEVVHRDYLAEAEFLLVEHDRQPIVRAFARSNRDSNGHVFRFLDMADALALRSASHGLRKLCGEHPWDDELDDPRTMLRRFPRRWRMAFPRAQSVSTRRATSEWLPFFKGCKRIHLSSGASAAVGAASNLTAVVDADLAAFYGATSVVIAGCNLPPELSSIGFAHFRGIRVLDISGNRRVRLTDGALAYLGGVRELSIGSVQCATVTEAGWSALAGIESLQAPYCWGLKVTDGALAHIKGIRVIDLTATDRSELTNAGVAHLSGARVVRLGSTPSSSFGGVDKPPIRISDAGFEFLASVEVGFARAPIRQ